MARQGVVSLLASATEIVHALGLTDKPGWDTLKAVRDRRVYITDGNQYFNRPGPRLVESAEILAEIFFPGKVSFGRGTTHWQVV